MTNVVPDTPSAFYNIVNNAGVFGALSWPLHRLGAAYYEGYIFLSVPRNGIGFYLDLAANPVQVENGRITLIPGGMTWGLRPLGQEIDGRIVSRVEAFGLDAPVVIWAEAPYLDRSGDVTATTLRYIAVPFDPTSGPVAPDISRIATLEFEGQPDANLLDFTTASANGRMYLFWTERQQSAIYWAEFDGQEAISKGTALTLPSDNIFSIDAARVQIVDPVSNREVTRIAVVALAMTGDDPPCQFTGWLVDPDGIAPPAPVAVPPLNQQPLPDPLSSCIRATWGTLASSGTCVTNGLVLSFVASRGAAEFNDIVNDVPTETGLGPLWVSVADLGNSGLSYGWTDARPNPGSAWGANAAAASAPLSVLFPLPIPGDDADQITYYIGQGVSSLGATLVEEPEGIEWVPQPEFYVNIFEGFHLLKTDAGTPQMSQYQRTFNDADIAAALSSWTMIGIVAGLPPHYAAQPAGTVSVSWSLELNTGTSSDASTTKSVTVGATLGPLKGSLETSVVQSDRSTITGQTGLTETWTNGHPVAQGGLPPDQGVAIFWQPAYQNGTFTIKNALGFDTGLTLSMIFAGSAGELGYVRFCLTNFCAPVGDEVQATALGAAFAAGFAGTAGASLVSFPRSDDLASWSAPPPANWLTQLLPFQGQSFYVGGAQVSHELHFGQDATLTTENILNISVDADADIFKGILGITEGGSLQLVSRVSATFGQSQSFVIGYDGVAGPAFNLHPLLLQPSTDNVPWLPSYSARQRPWLLTWVVS